MKQWILLLLLVACIAVVQAEDKTRVDMKSGTRTILALDTVVASDSIRVPVYFWTEYQEGFYNFTYIVRNIANNTKILLYYESALDTLHGYFNRTLIDSIVAAESTLVTHPLWITGTERGRYVVDGFGDAGDSSGVILILQAIPKQIR